MSTMIPRYACVFALGVVSVAFPVAAFGQGGWGAPTFSAPTETSALEAEKDRREAELAALEEEELGATSRLRRRTRTLYRLQRAGLLPVSEGISGLVMHRARLHRLKRMIEDDLASVASFTGRKIILREAVASLETRVQQARAQAPAATTEAYGVNFHGITLDVLEQAIAASSSGARQARTYSSPDGYGTLRVRDGASISGHTFAELRGYLDMPVASSAGVREARREDGIGLEISAPNGTAVRSVADGRVAFADSYAGYGRLIVVDHGDNYFTVYGGVGTVSVAVGANVMKGSTIGSLGLDGPTTGLYFEVRKGTRALDAASWLGV